MVDYRTIVFPFSDAVATVESVKAVTEVFTPVSGKVVAMNETLSDKPGKVNTSCYGEGRLSGSLYNKHFLIFFYK